LKNIKLHHNRHNSSKANEFKHNCLPKTLIWIEHVAVFLLVTIFSRIVMCSFSLFILLFIQKMLLMHSPIEKKNFLWRVTKNVFIYKSVVDDDVVCFIHLYSIEGKICMLLLPMSQHRLFTEQTLIPFGIFFSFFISLSFGIMIKI